MSLKYLAYVNGKGNACTYALYAHKKKNINERSKQKLYKVGRYTVYIHKIFPILNMS